MTRRKPWLANRGEGWVELNAPPDDCVLISITEPERKAKVPKGYLDLLRLQFQDYDPISRAYPKNAVLFSPSHAARISRFARKHRGKNILVHCAAGISRSGAVVEALLEAFPEYKDAGWQRYPNTHVKTLMKRAMGLVPIGIEGPDGLALRKPLDIEAKKGD
jgi:predicted protein tyrosine phosphatase